jgi:predicted enzyme involved in methoxymalonyl-ACP biosynthesis
VLGRGVEQYLMNHLFCRARELGLAKVSGEYIPSAKNGLVKDFWAGFGFRPAGELKWEQEIWRYQPTAITWISSVSSPV